MVNVYVLKLEKEKYYVGKTNKTIIERYQEHLNGFGSEWTSLYKPIEITAEIPNADDYEEDKQTKKYMSMYGIDNVRGGSYTSVKLPDYQIQALKTELCTSQNKCFICMQPGHFASDCSNQKSCFNKNYSPKKETVWYCDFCDKKFPTKYAAEKHEDYCSQRSSSDSDDSSDICHRCGKSGHWKKDCYAKYDIDGNYLR
jgi:predicted GIY-YIG superfamily endonuclease